MDCGANQGEYGAILYTREANNQATEECNSQLSKIKLTKDLSVMQHTIHTCDQEKIMEVHSDPTLRLNVRDLVDLMGNASYQGVLHLIVYEHNLPADFYILRTGVAGEILQKFSNYKMKLAIIGDFQKYTSESLQAFIRESNRGRQIFFVPDVKTAIQRMTSSQTRERT